MSEKNERGPMFVKEKDVSLTPEQKVVMERQLLQIKREKDAEKDAEYRRQDEELLKREMTAEDANAKQNYMDLQAMRKTYAAETVKGFTAPAGLIGEIILFAELWGKVFKRNLHKEFPSAGDFRNKLDELGRSVSRRIADKIEDIGRNETVFLAEMTYSAQLNEDGTLMVEAIALESDKLEPDMAEQDQEKQIKAVLRKLINEATREWLSTVHDFHMNKTDKCFYCSKTPFDKLSTEKFEALRDAPTNGLKNFLENKDTKLFSSTETPREAILVYYNP